MSERDELRDLQERAFQVAQMQEHPGWGILVAEVEAAMKRMSDQVLDGRCVPSQYNEFCGWLKGARSVLETQSRLESMVEARKH